MGQISLASYCQLHSGASQTLMTRVNSVKEKNASRYSMLHLDIYEGE